MIVPARTTRQFHQTKVTPKDGDTQTTDAPKRWLHHSPGPAARFLSIFSGDWPFHKVPSTHLFHREKKNTNTRIRTHYKHISFRQEKLQRGEGRRRRSTGTAAETTTNRTKDCDRMVAFRTFASTMSNVTFWTLQLFFRQISRYMPRRNKRSSYAAPRFFFFFSGPFFGEVQSHSREWPILGSGKNRGTSPTRAVVTRHIFHRS